MKNRSLFFITLAILMMITRPALATGSTAESRARQLVQAVFNQNPEDKVALVLAASGIDGSTENSLMGDLKDRGLNHKLTINGKNYFVVDGRTTGIQIKSFAPLEVTYESRTWKFDSARTVSKNYFDLLKFAEGNSKTSSVFMFGEPAYADGAFIVGMGAIGGGLATVLCAALEPCGAIVAGGILIGGVVGYGIDQKDQTNLRQLRAIAASDKRIICGNGQASLGGRQNIIPNQAEMLTEVSHNCTDQPCCDRLVAGAKSAATRALNALESSGPRDTHKDDPAIAR
jgi:hypothetical protein